MLSVAGEMLNGNVSVLKSLGEVQSKRRGPRTEPCGTPHLLYFKMGLFRLNWFIDPAQTWFRLGLLFLVSFRSALDLVQSKVRPGLDLVESLLRPDLVEFQTCYSTHLVLCQSQSKLTSALDLGQTWISLSWFRLG